jgi:hypothetical protein
LQGHALISETNRWQSCLQVFSVLLREKLVDSKKVTNLEEEKVARTLVEHSAKAVGPRRQKSDRRVELCKN